MSFGSRSCNRSLETHPLLHRTAGIKTQFIIHKKVNPLILINKILYFKYLPFAVFIMGPLAYKLVNWLETDPLFPRPKINKYAIYKEINNGLISNYTDRQISGL